MLNSRHIMLSAKREEINGSLIDGEATRQGAKKDIAIALNNIVKR